PPNEHVIRALLGLELYDQAIDELHYAQRLWGDSSPIQATLGWIYRERGDLRAGINAMKRAYPQYLAAGGENLPPELLKVLFPVNYWNLIRRYSSERHLDPYMMAALIAQESMARSSSTTFRSPRRRTTSRRFSAPQRTIGACTRRSRDGPMRSTSTRRRPSARRPSRPRPSPPQGRRGRRKRRPQKRKWAD